MSRLLHEISTPIFLILLDLASIEALSKNTHYEHVKSIIMHANENVGTIIISSYRIQTEALHCG